MSLSTWFRDYVYIPLGGSKGGKWQQIRNTFIIFIVSGFWHGANWTFIVWGFLNALYFLPLLLGQRNRTHLNIVAQDSLLPNVKEVLAISVTFLLTVIAWVFFRADNIAHAISYIQSMFSESLLSLPTIRPRDIIILIVVFMIIEWIGRKQQYAIEVILLKKFKMLRWSFYMILIALVLIFSNESPQEFIYFQF